jgi:hypothetical protein
MDEIVALLDREARDVELSPDAFQETLRRAKKRHQRTRMGGAVLALMIATAGTALAVAAFRSGPSRPAEGPVDVPDVTGLHVTEARRVLTSFGLRASIESSRRAGNLDRGSIVAQRPDRGTLPRGGTAHLTVAKRLAHGGPSRIVFTDSAIVRILRPGHYVWRSDPVPIPRSLGDISIHTRVVGKASGTSFSHRTTQSAEGMRVVLALDVAHVHGTAWLEILDASAALPPNDCAHFREQLEGLNHRLSSIRTRISHLQDRVERATTKKRVQRLLPLLNQLVAKQNQIQTLIRDLLVWCRGADA